ncbi:carbonic anhydrase [Exophiala viscosa]|uniref:Carbonic anhydrase n=1 Tax=Exophiala viscosa TaxID=2486360 RepID=A0AAN6IGD6_9EURO|nr:carbonic anhydrase [Exophiala viscosa]KAI1629391.1 carbonic anhydrase [Exophiala viscosa]
MATSTTTKSPLQENLVEKNAVYASTFNKGHLELPPSKHYAVLTCMDARIDPAAAYGIDLGDAHVIRNAGGNAIDALRSLVISQQLLGTKEIILIKHTGCGMLIFDTPTATGLVEKNLGAAGVEGLKKFVGGKGEFQTFTDLEEAVKKDVQLLKDSELIPDDIVISGWIYEVETGTVRSVV